MTSHHEWWYLLTQACCEVIQNKLSLDFVSHLDCACLPSIVKVTRHNHPLNLTYSLSTNRSGRKVCKLCVSRVDMDYGVYYCPSCDFVAHLHCATSKEDRDETFVPKSKDEESIESSSSIEDLGLDESIDSLAFVVKKIKLGVEGSEIAEEIKHFSHEHDLKLTDKVGINKKCNACMRSIFPPFYICAQCGFFLHKACVELPRKIRHPLHQHPLILRPKETIHGFYTPLHMLVTNINLFFLDHRMLKSAVVVIRTKDSNSVVLIVNSLWTSNV
ncbi:uncharacterized protein LOC118349848 [Juglans regia]|uniref:Uncharacterized protein LOC118349848 n=1 Tax=Juglans regia TaxID=51240 RepID=A0A6P9ERS3_JUGRE|nr:uncharacterized protein LOC118349848 [Juglans regia]